MGSDGDDIRRCADLGCNIITQRADPRSRIDHDGNSRGRLSLSIKVVFQFPLVMSRSPVVEALVRSATRSPASQNPSRSGIISIRALSSMMTPAS